MADLVTVEAAALWVGVAESDPHLERLVSVANSYVSSYLNRDDLETLDPVPPPIEQATLEVVANLYRNRTTNPVIASMSLGDGSVSFREVEAFDPIPASAKALLRPYYRLRVFSSC
jgi:hypothetical protein